MRWYAKILLPKSFKNYYSANPEMCHQKVARLPPVMCPPSILGFGRWMCVERESLVGWLVARLPWLPVANCQPFVISLFAVKINEVLSRLLCSNRVTTKPLLKAKGQYKRLRCCSWLAKENLFNNRTGLCKHPEARHCSRRSVKSRICEAQLLAMSFSLAWPLLALPLNSFFFFQLLRRNPERRLGASEKDAEDVRKQPFFRVSNKILHGI